MAPPLLTLTDVTLGFGGRPLFAGVAKAPEIARWGVCVMLGAAITAAMFLAMQISIVIG